MVICFSHSTSLFLSVCVYMCFALSPFNSWLNVEQNTLCLSNLLPFVYISLHLFGSSVIGFMCLRLTLQIHKLFVLNSRHTMGLGLGLGQRATI